MTAQRTLKVKVKANARQSLLEEDMATGAWRAKVKSPPREGQANRELIQLVAAHFECPPSAVSIKNGASSRYKHINIHQS